MSSMNEERLTLTLTNSAIPNQYRYIAELD